MRVAKIFLPREESAQTKSLVEEISSRLRYISFMADYENGKNPYHIEKYLWDPLSIEEAEKESLDSNTFFIISLERTDLLNLLLMAFNRSLPVIIIFDKKLKDLKIEQQYFLEKITPIHEVFYVSTIFEGAQGLRDTILREIL